MFKIFTKKNYKNVNSKQFQELMSEGENPIILDVRTRHEYQSGYIPGAKNLSTTDPAFITKLENFNKEKRYLVYCQSGSRSARVCRYMNKIGFEKVYNLKGGMYFWKGPVKR